MALILHFHGPSSVCSEADDVLAGCTLRNESGIYLWAVKQRTGGYRVLYIGETGNTFYARMREHVIQTLGGNYRVIDADRMCEGVQQVLWNGLWRKGTREKLPEFLSRYETL